MKKGTLQSFLRYVAPCLIAIGVPLVAAAPAGAAGSGYSPTPPPVSPTPPPTTCPSGTVITSSTLGAGGGTVSGSVDGSTLTVSVPSGDFPGGVQVAILDTSSIAIAPTGDSIVLAFGINFCANGAKVTGTFSQPVTVTITNPSIRPGQTLYLQTGSGLTPVTAQIVNGSLSLTIDSDPDFVLVTAAQTTGVISGATTVVTGKPFLLEGIVAGVMVLAGVLLLVGRLRLRHR